MLFELLVMVVTVCALVYLYSQILKKCEGSKPSDDEKTFFLLYTKVADLEQENEELLRMMGAAKITQEMEDYENFKQQYRENITEINKNRAKMDEILVRDRNI